MKHKRLIGLYIIAWTVIVTNLILLGTQLGLFVPFLLCLQDRAFLIDWIAITPAFENLFYIPPLTVKPWIDTAWSIIMLFCCIGILKKRNYARIAFISICIINTLIFYLSFPIKLILSVTPIPLLIVLIYIIYFSLPKIKELFK